LSTLVVDCYDCCELLLCTRSKRAAAANKRKDDGQLDGEKYFSGCLSFRQRVVAKKAIETNKRNNFSFFNQFFDAVVGILLADSV